MNEPTASFLDPVLAAAGARRIDDKTPVASMPPGYTLASLRAYGQPEQEAGTVAVHSLGSLVEYLDRHAINGSAVFAAGREVRLISAVIDWHGVPSTANDRRPGWARHKAEYKLEFTPEWLAWTGISGRAIAQQAFAEFVEENLPDIVEPDAATVLEVVRNLSGNRKVKFGSSRNLANGDVALQWIEETDAGAGPNQETKVPSELKLRLPVFRGAEKCTTYEVKAFLRYRIKDGTLSFELKLHRPERALDGAFEDVVAELMSAIEARALPNLPVYRAAVAKSPAEVLA